MWSVTSSRVAASDDTERLLSLLNNGPHADFFDVHAPLYVARAPGRLDVMGGIADYSGSLVLQMPLAVATFVAVQDAPEPYITILSVPLHEQDAEGEALRVSFPHNDILPFAASLTEEAAHELLTRDPQRAWASYVAGVLVELRNAYGVTTPQGLRILVYSEVPQGKGVSSSASLEVATMRALCALYDIPVEGREMALLCQRTENFIVGAPCGVMDQMTAACGEPESLLALLCQPAELQSPVSLPPDIEVWGIDSGIRHAVTGADYGSVRTGAFMGYRIIAERIGLPVRPLSEGRVTIDDTLWHGYLANISPSLWEMHFRQHVPETLDGATFLERYGGITDTVTRIDPTRIYAVRQPTAHPIYEHHRVRLFRTLLAQIEMHEELLTQLGELMYQSHASYSACKLGSAGTDTLVALVREMGTESGLYGAKITGGGSGGTVAVLARRGSDEAIAQLVLRYETRTGLHIEVMRGSSPGAVMWGGVHLHRV